MEKKENNVNINYRKIENTLSNGDWKKGRKIMSKIAERLDHARTKHPKEEWHKMDVYEAMKALLDEIDEVRIAIKKETPERVQDELLDVIAVSLRILNKEYGA